MGFVMVQFRILVYYYVIHIPWCVLCDLLPLYGKRTGQGSNTKVLIPLVASKCVHVRKKPEEKTCPKHDMFYHQTFEVWSTWLLST